MKGLQQLALVSLMLGLVAACSQRSDSAKPPQAAVNSAPAEKPVVSSGYVVMRYRLNGDGYPIDIEVLESSPKGIFEAEAVRALSKWRPDAAMGKHKQPLKNEYQEIRLDFEVDQSEPESEPAQPQNDQNSNTKATKQN